MNKSDYITVSRTHSPVIAEYVLKQLSAEDQKLFKTKGLSQEVIDPLVEQWLAV